MTDRAERPIERVGVGTILFGSRLRGDAATDAMKGRESMYMQDIAGEVDGFSDFPLHTRFEYCQTDPFAVTMFFPHQGTRWVFARDLLFAAVLDGAAGIGDVQMLKVTAGVINGTLRNMYLFSLRSTEGEIHILYPQDDVDRFVEEVWSLVPPGSEGNHTNLDEKLKIFQERECSGL